MQNITCFVDHDWAARNVRCGKHADKTPAGSDGKPSNSAAGKKQGGIMYVHILRHGDDVSGHNSGGCVLGRIGRDAAQYDVTIGDDPEDYLRGPRIVKIAERNLRTVDEVAENVLSRIQ